MDGYGDNEDGLCSKSTPIKLHGLMKHQFGPLSFKKAGMALTADLATRIANNIFSSKYLNQILL